MLFYNQGKPVPINEREGMMMKKGLAGVAAICCLLAVALPVGAQTVTANITGTGKCYSSRTSYASGKLETYYNTGTVVGEGAYQNGTYHVVISLKCGGGDVREGSSDADGSSRYWRAQGQSAYGHPVTAAMHVTI